MFFTFLSGCAPTMIDHARPLPARRYATGSASREELDRARGAAESAAWAAGAAAPCTRMANHLQKMQRPHQQPAQQKRAALLLLLWWWRVCSMVPLKSWLQQPLVCSQQTTFGHSAIRSLLMYASVMTELKPTSVRGNCVERATMLTDDPAPLRCVSRQLP
jgi:hypothetical protein